MQKLRDATVSGPLPLPRPEVLGVLAENLTSAPFRLLFWHSRGFNLGSSRPSGWLCVITAGFFYFPTALVQQLQNGRQYRHARDHARGGANRHDKPKTGNAAMLRPHQTAEPG